MTLMKTLRIALKLIATIVAASHTPLSAQQATPAQAATAIMLGSWNTQVEVDAVKVACGSEPVLDDAFDRENPGWNRQGGDWRVADGVLRQSSSATPALARHPFTCAGSDYTIRARMRKTDGGEGFLVGFGAQDEKNFYWLNLGGWGNTAHRLEKTVDGRRAPVGPGAEGRIENGRWYEVRIDVRGNRIQCFLDERKIIEAIDSGFTLPPDNDILNFGQALLPDLNADPSISEIDDTFYLYATTDGWGRHLATSGTPVVWTSKDFLNWSFEGSSFPSDFDAKYWAPSSLVPRDGRYYSFPTLDAKITPVVADSPAGPCLAPDGRHVTSATLQPHRIEQKHSIDAEVFVDDDGQAYMVWALNRIVKLKPDLLTPDAPVTKLPVKRTAYSEGPFLTKRKGVYYYFYTLGGDEVYHYAYMMSRVSPMGPWETPEQDIIATTDRERRIFGPGHGCFFNPKGSEQWYFIYLEYGRGGTNRQIYADKMNFNPDGTIQPISLTKEGVGAVRPVENKRPNLALTARATASSVLPNARVAPRKDPLLDRSETHAPVNALDGYNGTRWMAAAGDSRPWFQVDLGATREIKWTEAYFVKPADGHAYTLETSLDGVTWRPYGGHDARIRRSPHRDAGAVPARYLKLTILEGAPGLWEFRVY